MNSERLTQLLGETIVSVFGETVFALMDRDPEATPHELRMVQSLVGFSGTYTGSLALEVEASGVCQLASDFLGTEPSTTDARDRHDVVGELANIVAGRLLETWQPDATNYDVGIPTVSVVTHGQSRLLNEPSVCRVEFRTDSNLHIVVAILLGVWP
jgi:CheY-specific phosphatase CheX